MSHTDQHPYQMTTAEFDAYWAKRVAEDRAAAERLVASAPPAAQPNPEA